MFLSPIEMYYLSAVNSKMLLLFLERVFKISYNTAKSEDHS